VRVANGPGADGPGQQGRGGYGLTGLRERVAMLHGEFQAGGDGNDGFVVSALLPEGRP